MASSRTSSEIYSPPAQPNYLANALAVLQTLPDLTGQFNNAQDRAMRTAAAAHAEALRPEVEEYERANRSLLLDQSRARTSLLNAQASLFPARENLLNAQSEFNLARSKKDANKQDATEASAAALAAALARINGGSPAPAAVPSTRGVPTNEPRIGDPAYSGFDASNPWAYPPTD